MYQLPTPYTTPFLVAAKSPNREIDTRIVLNYASGTKVDLDTTSVATYKITKSSTAGKSFTPGSFVAGQLEASLVASSSSVEGLNLKNSPFQSLEVKAGIQTTKGMAYVPMGIFYPTDDGVTFGDDGFIEIQALDIPSVLSGKFDSAMLTMPCSVSDALGYISTQTGLSIVASAEDFPNLEVELSKTFSLTTTYREAIMYIAEAIGAYANMGREGEVRLGKLFGESTDLGGVVFNEDYLYSVEAQESTVKPYQYINIKANADDVGVTREVEGVSTECKYDILDNPLTYGHPEDFLEGLVEPLSSAEFHPSKVSFHGRPDIDLGDVLTYVYRGLNYSLPVCSHVFEYGGGFKTTIESIGSDTLETSSVDSGIKSKITVLRQNLNTLIRDLSQTQSQITDINNGITQVSTLLQTASSLQAQISKLEGDMEQLSTLTQTTEGLKLQIESVRQGVTDTSNIANSNQSLLLSYFDFQADGLVIGVNSSNIKLKLINDRIQFLKDDATEVAYFSEGQLYVSDAHFLRSLIVGNFELIPRKNGNLSLRYRG